MNELYHYSCLIEPEKVLEAGGFTIFPVRINNRDDVANEATNQFIADWMEQFNDDLAENLNRTNLCELGNVSSLLFPETSPERLRILAYLVELITRHDDVCELMGGKGAALANANLETAMNIANPQASTSGSMAHKLQKIVAQALLDAIVIDRQKALNMIDALRNNWLANMNDRDPEEFESLDSYLAFRRVNFATSPVSAMAAFAIDVDIAEDMVTSNREIIDCLCKIMILTNDYYSWGQEFVESQKPGERAPFNAVHLFMRIKSLSAKDAQQMVKEIIIAEEAKFLQLRNEVYRANPEISLDARRGLEMAGVMVGGHHYWCTQCPRYHSCRKEGINKEGDYIADRQLDSVSVKSELNTPPSSIDKLDVEDDGKPVEGRLDGGMRSIHESPTQSGRHIPWYKPSDQVLRMPCDYIRSMPSKGVRDSLTNALNDWLRAPDHSVQAIMEAVQLLHDASLILDDIEDNSPIRRGKPAVHTVFGHSQAIHAANFMSVQATRKVRELCNDLAMDVLLDELENLYLGQSLDLNWKFELRCPAEEEYLNMVDNKTGGMFRLLIRLLQAEAPEQGGINLSFDHFATLFGRFFQIRDDYMNLRSSVYANQKGPCEDLDEGKFSYPIVHCLLNSPIHKSHILGIFRQRPTALGADPKPLSVESKNHILACLEESGALKATIEYVNELEADIDAEIRRLEKLTGEENTLLRLLLKKLSLVDEVA
ncbi:Bifunctional sesterterpene synthase astC [Cladobotryum mycophilum]|uniref:Bifunctional sesterterpene synthase astC n=1 Tax=Cladobotryum mycophilum TaxID=491253 RepID=A0ABR0SRL8_9HYPO